MTRKQSARIKKWSSRPFVEITVVTTWDGFRQAIAVPLNDDLRAKCTRKTTTALAAANPNGILYAVGAYDDIAHDEVLVERLGKIMAEAFDCRVWEEKAAAE